jgi:hypothetical protein
LEEIRKSVCFILDYVAENFKCPIVFYTGTYFGNAEYEKMIELLYCLKNEYGFYILDLYNDEAMRCVNRDAYLKYMNDPIHPTLLGYEEWWTPKFIDFCKRIP